MRTGSGGQSVVVMACPPVVSELDGTVLRTRLSSTIEMGGDRTEPTAGPSARKRQTILSAGRGLFLSNGYQGTSVDQIAASAEVSKQTVYKHFGDKQELLLAIVKDALNSTVTPFLDRIARLADTNDLEADLNALAGEYLRAVLAEP